MEPNEKDLIKEMSDEAQAKFSELMGKYDINQEDRETIYTSCQLF